MKTLLLTVLLITSAAQADQWLVNGRTYKGTLHKFNADRTQVWVTSDWDNYGGSWIKVADLDPATRVRLNVATPQEQALVQAQMEQIRQFEAQASAQMEQNRQLNAQALAQAQMEQRRLLQAQAQPSANATYAASPAQHNLNLQLQQDARRLAQTRRSSSSQVYIVPRYSHHHYYRSSPYVHVPHVHVPHVHVGQPIIIRTN